jgi:hypothetical protein
VVFAREAKTSMAQDGSESRRKDRERRRQAVMKSG